MAGKTKRIFNRRERRGRREKLFKIQTTNLILKELAETLKMPFSVISACPKGMMPYYAAIIYQYSFLDFLCELCALCGEKAV